MTRSISWQSTPPAWVYSNGSDSWAGSIRAVVLRAKEDGPGTVAVAEGLSQPEAMVIQHALLLCDLEPSWKVPFPRHLVNERTLDRLLP